MSVRKSVNYKNTKIEFGKNNIVLIRVPYNQEIIKKVKTISFTTHLLESGVDLRYIREIFGHKSSKTTEIYTHVSRANIASIKSPFDAILVKEEI